MKKAKKNIYKKPVFKEVKVGGRFMQYVHAMGSGNCGSCASSGCQHGC